MGEHKWTLDGLFEYSTIHEVEVLEDRNRYLVVRDCKTFDKYAKVKGLFFDTEEQAFNTIEKKFDFFIRQEQKKIADAEARIKLIEQQRELVRKEHEANKQ